MEGTSTFDRREFKPGRAIDFSIQKCMCALTCATKKRTSGKSVLPHLPKHKHPSARSLVMISIKTYKIKHILFVTLQLILGVNLPLVNEVVAIFINSVQTTI